MTTTTDTRRPVEPDDALVARYQRMVWRHLRFLGAPPDVADDLMQDTFVVLLRRPPDDHGQAELAAWLRVTARNLFRAAGRRARAGVPLDDDAAIEGLWARVAPDVDGSAWLTALDACLATLDARERRLVELRYREGASRDVIAAESGVGIEGVKSLLRRIKDRLRRCVERRIGDADR